MDVTRRWSQVSRQGKWGEATGVKCLSTVYTTLLTLGGARGPSVRKDREPFVTGPARAQDRNTELSLLH